MTTKTVLYTFGNGDTENRLLLIADEGKALTQDGESLFNAVEVTSSDGWREVDAPAEESEEESREELKEALELALSGGTE